MADAGDDGGASVAAAERARLSDAIERLGAGDSGALADIYRRTAPKLFGICLRILGERSDAEEVVQDIYVTLWRKAGAFDRDRSSPITWLAVLARNRAIDRLRARGRRERAPIEEARDMPDSAPDPEARAADAGERRRLAHCLGTIDPADAGFIRTAFLDGATYPELAERAALPLGTVKSRIRRALLRLRACMAAA